MVTRTRPTSPPRSREALGLCAACGEHVPLYTITGYQRNGGNTPLCPECSIRVQCDCCHESVPFGLCQVDDATEATCNWCAGEPGFWPSPPAVTLSAAPLPAYECPFDAIDIIEMKVAA